MSVAPPSSFRDPFAPPSKPLPPPPPEPLRKRPIFWIIGGLSALLVVVGSAALTVLLWPRKVPALPWDPTHLPDNLRSVSRWRHNPKLPIEVFESEMMPLCGGPNLARIAMNPERPLAVEVLADLIVDREETQKTVACAVALAKNLGDGPHYILNLAEKKKESSYASVYVYPLTLDAFPHSGTHLLPSSDPKKLAWAGCLLDEKGVCPDRATVVGRIPNTTLWLAGNFDTTSSVAEAYAAKGNDDRAKLMAELAPHFEKFDSVELGNSTSEFYFRALDRLDDFSEDVQKARTKFKKSLEASNAVFGFGETMGFSSDDNIPDHLEITMQREGDAPDVAKSLNELRVALKHAKEREAHDLPREERRASEAEQKIYRRAIGDAEVVQKDNLITFDVVMKAEPDEKQAIVEYDKDLLERAKRASELFRVLQKGEAPKDDLIQLIGGRDLVRAIATRKDGGASDHPSNDKPPIELQLAKGFVLPGDANDPAPVGTHFVYKDPDPGFFVRLTSGLRDAGWVLRLQGVYNGAFYECIKDGVAVSLSIHVTNHEAQVDVHSLE